MTQTRGTLGSGVDGEMGRCVRQAVIGRAAPSADHTNRLTLLPLAALCLCGAASRCVSSGESVSDWFSPPTWCTHESETLANSETQVDSETLVDSGD